MRDAYLRRIHQAMKTDNKIFFISADFGSPVLDDIRRDFPERFVNVGVAEQNLINISSGLSLEGFKVFAYAIAPFITMRCFEQLRVNLALLSEVRDINVTLIGVGAGYSYVVSGPTHQCYEDLTLIRSLPNFKFISPSDHVASEGFFDYCLSTKGIKYLRLDAQILPVIEGRRIETLIGNGFELVREGSNDGVIVSTGFMTHTALKVATKLSDAGYDVSVVDLVNLTDFCLTKLLSFLKTKSLIISLEEGFEGRGGLDALIRSTMSDASLSNKFIGIGVKPGYSFELGSRQELHEKVGIGEDSVFKRAYDHLRKSLEK